MTAYHAKYFAHKLTKRCPSDIFALCEEVFHGTSFSEK
jgi:hypothetical protein